MTEFEKIEKIKGIIEDLLKHLEAEGTVTSEESLNRGLVFNVQSPDSYMLIGKQGANLQAFQQVVQAMVNKIGRDTGEMVFFSLDVDDYRKKREWFLKEAAKSAVGRVKLTGKPVILEPMSSFERRLVHSYIQEHYTEVETSSEGVDPYRKVVVNLKKLQ